MNFIFLLTTAEPKELKQFHDQSESWTARTLSDSTILSRDQKYANSREATRTSGNRFHLLPAQIMFSNRSHLLPNYIVQHPYISMYSRSQPASTHSTTHDATVGEHGRKQKFSVLRTSPGSLWRLHTRFDLFRYRLVAQRK